MLYLEKVLRYFVLSKQRAQNNGNAISERNDIDTTIRFLIVWIFSELIVNLISTDFL